MVAVGKRFVRFPGARCPSSVPVHGSGAFHSAPATVGQLALDLGHLSGVQNRPAVRTLARLRPTEWTVSASSGVAT